MKHKSKCRRTTIVCDTWNQIIHESKGHGISDQEKDKCRVKRKLYFQTSRERHLIRMWVIFQDRKSIFTNIDRNVFAIVEDKDILEFQKQLAKATGDMRHTIIEDCLHLQNFIGNEYYAKLYIPMTPQKDMIVRQERPKLEIPRVSLFRDVELPSPCSNGQ